MKINAIIISLMAIAVLGPAHAAIITQWDFEDDTLTPSIGTGTAGNVGETSSAFATGNGGGRGWNTLAYAAQGEASGERGVQFFVSTAGFTDISLSFDHRASGTASRWAQIDYTLDGGESWEIGFWNNNGGLSPHDAFYAFNVDFSSIAGANNNPDFGFRIVSVFSPLAFNENSVNSFEANTAYMRANANAKYQPEPGTQAVTSAYAPGGTWRFDNVTVQGIPEPTTALLGLLGSALLLRRKRGA